MFVREFGTQVDLIIIDIVNFGKNLGIDSLSFYYVFLDYFSKTVF